jgi:hypothetical protein
VIDDQIICRHSARMEPSGEGMRKEV